MKKTGFLKSHAHRTALTTCLLLLGTILLSGCGKTKIEVISNYDAQAYEQTQQLKKQVDDFFVSLLAKAPVEREYSNFDQPYQEVFIKLTKFDSDNKARSKNSESSRISKSIVELWQKYRNGHKVKNNYSDGNAKLNRSRFSRLFKSAARAELAKKRK